jgi:cyclopropane-fatty-acyl-phospholipid synthase
MDLDKNARIKNAIRGNFDESPQAYQEFEDRYGFFRKLNHMLASKMALQPAALILDVGCGAGASSAQMLDGIPKCCVWGLDISGAMLETARLKLGDSDRVRFVQGDAAKLADCFDFTFDAVVYSASIFLVPDYQESLRQAKDLLRQDGRVGLTFMDGLYDSSGRNAFIAADERAKEGVSVKRPVDLRQFEDFFRGLFPCCDAWSEDLQLGEELLRAFFSVPAMSAGLFPGIEYPERVRKVNRLFDYLRAVECIFRWRFMVGRRSRVISCTC